MDDILQLLRDYLGVYKKTSNTNGSNNYAFPCPFCGHHKKKLEVDLTKGYWHCWVCNHRGRSLYTLFKKLRAPYSVLRLFRTRSSRPRVVTTTEKRTVVLPDGFIPLWKKTTKPLQTVALNYLSNRGVTLEDIHRYRIGYCVEGAYNEMIIVPSYAASGELNYFIGRSFRDWSRIRHLGPSVEKDIIGLESMIDWNFPIVIVEGIFDAIAVRRNAIPLFGKIMRSKLKQTIVEKKPPCVYIAVDPDARREMVQIVDYFTQFGIDARIVDLHDADPSEHGFSKFWETLTGNSKSIGYYDILLEKIKMKL